MQTSNIKKLKIANKDVKFIKIGDKVAWQGLPEFTIGTTKHNPETFPAWYTINDDTTVNFSNFDNTSFKLTAYLVGGGGGGGCGWARTSGSNAGYYVKVCGAGGGQGGEVKSQVVNVDENTDYALSIGNGGSGGTGTDLMDGPYGGGYCYGAVSTTSAGDGGNTTGFGITARGGKHGNALSGWLDDSAITPPSGGTGNGGAAGGIGSKYSYTQPSWSYAPASGSAGTTINGTVYGTGGHGAGGDWQRWGYWDLSGYGPTKVEYPDASAAIGYGNAGSGGKGGRGSGTAIHGNQGSASYCGHTNGTAGQKGIVLLKIEEI